VASVFVVILVGGQWVLWSVGSRGLERPEWK
jgi:hypothetical protein